MSKDDVVNTWGLEKAVHDKKLRAEGLYEVRTRVTKGEIVVVRSETEDWTSLKGGSLVDYLFGISGQNEE